jgi:hypothetical protein
MEYFAEDGGKYVFRSGSGRWQARIITVVMVILIPVEDLIRTG